MKIVLSLIAVMFLLVGCGDAVNTAYNELKPSTLLKKYEWFKDTSAQLDKKVADIKVYEQRMKAVKESYGTEPRSKWDRTDKEQFNQWVTELAGVKASYNGLAAEYNSQMAKVNWRFCNAGTVPDGGEPLPREYRTYMSN